MYYSCGCAESVKCSLLPALFNIQETHAYPTYTHHAYAYEVHSICRAILVAGQTSYAQRNKHVRCLISRHLLKCLSQQLLQL